MRSGWIQIPYFPVNKATMFFFSVLDERAHLI